MQGEPMSLPRAAQVRRFLGRAEVAAPWIDVESATSCIARIDRQFLWRALAQDVDKDALHALFVELIVFPKADHVSEQAFLVDLRPDIMNLHAAPVGLARHQAI